MKLSVIIPVFNEEKTVGQLIKKVLAERTPKEIIVVNDGSTDKTQKEIDKLKSRRLVKLSFPENQGKGTAVRAGLKKAQGEFLIIQDADLEYDPKDYSRLLKPIQEGQAKVVYGTRLKKLPLKILGKDKTPLPLHYLVNRFLSVLTNLFYGSHLTDMETGYKMISREVYSQLKLVSNRFEIEPEITAKILKKGYPIIEVPIKTQPRGYKEGKKIKAKDALLAVFTLFRYL